MVEGGTKNDIGTAKRCVPVLEACSNGYIIPAWCDFDVHVSDKGDVGVRTPSTLGIPDFVGSHPWVQVGDDCPLKNYFAGKCILKLQNPWVIETSPGWSCLIKSPPNAYNNVRFIEGVVDTDTYVERINLPFFWDGYKAGTYEIKKGDPLVHVVPFRREALQVKYEPWDEEYMNKIQGVGGSMFINRYRKLYWHKRKNK